MLADMADEKRISLGRIRKSAAGILLGCLGFIPVGAFLLMELKEEGSLASVFHHLGQPHLILEHIMIFAAIPAFMVLGYFYQKQRDLSKNLEKLVEERTGKLALVNEKLSVVGKLTRHDVGNKLNTIRGNVYLTKQGLSGRHEALEYLGNIESTVGQVVEFFDFAKTYESLGDEVLSYISVADAVEGAFTMFSDLQDVEMMNDCGGLIVLADSLLSRLLYNLIDNSLKHGERVNRIRVYWEEAKDELKLVYEDDGVGISEAEKEKIFEQGYGKGSGLGLYLIKKMCSVYGWTIKETGKPGKGVKFIMTSPKVNVDEGKTGYQTKN